MAHVIEMLLHAAMLGVHSGGESIEIAQWLKRRPCLSASVR